MFPVNTTNAVETCKTEAVLTVFSIRRDRRKFRMVVYVLNVSNFYYSNHFKKVQIPCWQRHVVSWSDAFNQ
jgi:hypothetical protein